MEVVTETSTYIIDMDEQCLWRVEGGAGSLDNVPIPRATLRRDGQRIPLLTPPKAVVGWPCLLVLQLRPDGTTTLRYTTRVCHINRLR